MNRRLKQPKASGAQLRMLPASQMPKPGREGPIKKAILQALSLHPDVACARTHAGRVQLISGHWMHLGPEGWPDISGTVRGGRSFYLETKSDVGQLTPEQREVHAYLRSLGAYVGVARSLSDAFAHVEEARKS